MFRRSGIARGSRESRAGWVPPGVGAPGVREDGLGDSRRDGAEDRKMDFEDLTDDEEVALNLPQKGAEERNPPGEEIRDFPGGHRFGGTGDSAGGRFSDGASAWGSTKMEPSGTTNLGD